MVSAIVEAMVKSRKMVEQSLHSSIIYTVCREAITFSDGRTYGRDPRDISVSKRINKKLLALSVHGT